MTDRTVKVRLVADIQSYRDAMARAGKATRDFGTELTANTRHGNEALADVGRAGIVAGGALVVGFGLAANAAMGFEKQISDLGAVSGATAADMEALRQAALDAGRDTAFSASQAAEAQTELAKAGVSTADILGGGLTGALDLAAAGNLELSRAAEIAAGAMTTFGLEGRDVQRIADALAAGANKSAADVDDMAQAMGQSALVADQLGISLEETVGTLAMFAQNGLRGSDAGTSFKTMLQRLVPQSAEAAETMERLGIDFFDAQGRFVGLDEAAQELQDGLANLSQEQRAAALTTMFGSDAIRAATIFYEGGAAGVTEWTGAVTDSGYAADLARQKMDNLAGDLEELRGSIETALIEGGSQATGVLRFLTQSATDAVNTFGELPGVMQAGLVGFTGIAGGGLLLAGTIGSLIPKIREFRVGLEGLGPAGARINQSLGAVGATAGKIGILTTALFVLDTALDSLHEGPSADLSLLANDLLDLADTGRVVGELASAMGGDLDKLREAIERVAAPSTSTQIGHIVNDVTSLGGILVENHDLDDARARIDLLDKALADLAAQDPTAAAAAFRELSSALAQEGVPVERLRGLLDDYGAALADVDTQERLATDATEDLTGGLEDAADAAEAAQEALQAYRDSLRASFDPVFAMAQALRDQTEAQANLNTVMDDSSSTIADVEEALWRVQDANIAVDEAAADLAAGMRDGSVSVDAFRAQLDRWVYMGSLTADQAAIMYQRFLEVRGVADSLQGRNVDIAVNADTGPAMSALNALQTRLSNLANAGVLIRADLRVPHAAGGYARGPGTGDTVPALLTPGEFVIRKPAADALGPDLLYRLNRADTLTMADGGYTPDWRALPAGGGEGGWSMEAVVSELRGLREDVVRMRAVNVHASPLTDAESVRLMVGAGAAIARRSRV